MGQDGWGGLGLGPKDDPLESVMSSLVATIGYIFPQSEVISLKRGAVP